MPEQHVGVVQIKFHIFGQLDFVIPNQWNLISTTLLGIIVLTKYLKFYIEATVLHNTHDRAMQPLVLDSSNI